MPEEGLRKSARFENALTVIKLLRELIMLIVTSTLVVLCWPLVKPLTNTLKQAITTQRVKTLNILKFLEVTFEEAAQAVPTISPGPQEPPPQSDGISRLSKVAELKEAVQQLDSAISEEAAVEGEGKTAWVYLGTFAKGKWSKPSFNTTRVPQSSDSIRALIDVFARDAAPSRIKGDEWRLGRVVGVVRQRKEVKVRTVQEVDNDEGVGYWWAQIVFEGF